MLRDGARRVARASASIGALVLAASIPKCPLCVAAALSAAGAGATLGTSLAPFARPLAVALAVAALVAFFTGEWLRRKRRARRRSCCAHEAALG
jgi:hypothetical protein